MRSYVPHFLTNTKLYSEIVKAEGAEFDAFRADIDDVLNQFFVETATWGLDAWDKFTGLETKKYEIDERRKIIMARLSSQPPFSRNNLLAVLGQLAEGAEINEFPDIYSFDVVLKTRGTFKGAYLTQIIDYVESMRPAHLDYKVIIDYLHSLILNVKFAQYQSEVLSKCGTLLCEEEPWDTTSGRSFRDALQLDLSSWFSEVLRRSSQIQHVQNDQGRSFRGLVTLVKSSWQSSVLPVVSGSLIPLGTSGREWSERMSQSTAVYFSTPYLRCGNVAVSGEVRT